MKTLNRTLSLVLVLVMVLGMFGIAGAAFKDQDEVKYNEAVGVMTGIGAINGYEDGSVKPAGSITREEAAKLVAYAVLGADVAKNLKVGTNAFKDVAADRWSAPFIGYCVAEGIINGMGDGTFAPTANVTGYQLAKMLLCAAGYGSQNEFTGSAWELAVAVAANKAGIFKDAATVNYSTAATREEAMLYAFNGIQVPQVEYNKVFGSYVSNKGFGNPATSIAYDVYGLGKVNGNLVKTDTVDAGGRPAVKWTYKGATIGTYSNTEAYVFTTNKNDTAGKAELAKTFKGFTVMDTDSATPGVQNKAVINGKADVTDLAAATLAAQIAAYTGNGVTVEVYVSENNITQVEKVTVTKNDIAVVAAVDAARKTVTLTTKTNAPVVGLGTYTIKDGDDFYPVVKDLKVGEYVVVTPAWDGATYGIANAYVPTQVKGYVGAVNGLTNTVYLNGTNPYVKAAVATAAVGSIAVNTTQEATLWLDANGFIVHSKTAAVATKNFVYVLDAYQTLVSNKLVNMAKVVYTDGTTADVAVKNAASAGLFHVKDIANDVYELEAFVDATTSTTGDLATLNTVVSLKATGIINAYDKRLTLAAQNGPTNYNNNFYASDVKFIYVNTVAKTATVKTGVQGVASLPTNAYALVEAMSASDSTPVVTAVILVDGVAATVDSQNLVYFGATGLVGGSNPAATPIGSMALMNKTTNKYETFPVHAGFINGTAVANGVPTKSINTGVSPYGIGFYSYAKSDDTGAYILAPYALTSGKTAVQVMKPVTSTFDDKLITVNGVLVDISDAVFGDVRAEAAQAAQPVIMNAAGICATAEKYGINVSVVYDATTGKASIVYINAVDTGFKIGTQASGVTFATGTIANGATDLATGTAVETGTTKIPAGTTVYVMAATNDKIPVNAGVTLTLVTAKSATQKGIYSFVMPSYGIAANAFTES